MKELFLLAALALPSSYHTWPAIVSYHAMTDEEFANRLRKLPAVEDVFIHESPQEDKLKENGWERFPATYKDKQIWIRRKPASDKRAIKTSA